MGIAFTAIAAGLGFQALGGTLLPGLLLVLAGNLLLLTRGYDNRVDFGKYDPATAWERAGIEKLAEIRRLERRMRSWDFSILDVTSALGATILVVLLGALGALAWFATGVARILAIDGLVLLAPHWLTGIRRILTLPGLLVKVRTIESLLKDAQEEIGRHRLDVLVLLAGEGTARLPVDVKFKIVPEGANEDFLGLYGQVSLNEVQGTSYPYFYVVVVARRGFGLEGEFVAYQPPYRTVVKEFKTRDDVEVLVLRQHADRRGGWHTKPASQRILLREGLRLAERVAPGRAPSTAP
jgi:hypothetical protein